MPRQFARYIRSIRIGGLVALYFIVLSTQAQQRLIFTLDQSSQAAGTIEQDMKTLGWELKINDLHDGRVCGRSVWYFNSKTPPTLENIVSIIARIRPLRQLAITSEKDPEDCLSANYVDVPSSGDEDVLLKAFKVLEEKLVSRRLNDTIGNDECITSDRFVGLANLGRLQSSSNEKQEQFVADLLGCSDARHRQSIVITVDRQGINIEQFQRPTIPSAID